MESRDERAEHTPNSTRHSSLAHDSDSAELCWNDSASELRGPCAAYVAMQEHTTDITTDSTSFAHGSDSDRLSWNDSASELRGPCTAYVAVQE